jgi:hypothetical protein
MEAEPGVMPLPAQECSAAAKAGEAGKDFPSPSPFPSEGARTYPHLDFELGPPEPREKIFLSFQSPALWHQYA